MSDDIGRLMQDEGINPEADEPELSRLSISDEVWDHSYELRHIRQAARAKRVPPDFLLAAVLARVSMLTPPSLLLPDFVGDLGSFDWYTGLIGEPGAGKSSAMKLAKRLIVHERQDVQDGIPLGSGEGITEAFFVLSQGEGRTVHVREYDAVLLNVDEGNFLRELSGRQGSTLVSVLNSGYTGASIGQTNVEQSRRRHLPQYSYRLAMVVNFQPANAAALLADVDLGAPQRYHFVFEKDFQSPIVRPDFPGKLDFVPPAKFSNPKVMDCDSGIGRAIDDRRQARLVNPASFAAHGHDDLARLKLSGLLAVLHGEFDTITMDYWDLAGLMMDPSLAIKSYVSALATEKIRLRELMYDQRVVQRKIMISELREKARIDGFLENIVRKLRRENRPLSMSQCIQTLHSRYRDEYGELVIDVGIERGTLFYDGNLISVQD